MAYNITYLNQIVADLGGSDTYIYEIDALNAICTLLGITAGHTYKIDALNAIEVNQGGSGGHKYNIDALNSIITLAGETAGYTYEPLAWAAIQQGALLNQNEPEIDAFITALITPISDFQVTSLNTLIRSIKTGLGITELSEAFDLLLIRRNETQESALRNFVKNAHHSELVNSPAFEAMSGFTGNGTNAYIKLNYNANTQGVNFTLNNGSIGVYCNNNTDENQADIGARVGYQNQMCYVECNSAETTNNKRNNINTDTDVLLGSTKLAAQDRPSNGMHIFNRINSTTVTTYINGTLYSDSANSTAIPNLAWFELAINGNGTPTRFTTRSHALVFAGRAFTKDECDIIKTAFDVYKNA